MPSAPDHFITYATLSPEGQDQHPNLAGLIFLVDHHHQLAWPSTCSPQHARARLAAINPPLSDTDLYRTLTANPDLTILNRAPAHRWRPGDKFIVAPDAPATQHIHPGQTVRLPFSFCPPTHSASPDDVIFVDDPNTSSTPAPRNPPSQTPPHPPQPPNNAPNQPNPAPSRQFYASTVLK